MLVNNIFYHGITRKTIVAFGTLFSDIKIRRTDKNGANAQTINVPISYAPKEKWVVRINNDPTLDNHTYTILPRMSFEITNYSYDPLRKMNRANYISCGGDGVVKKTYSPVPYNIDINLYILTKTQEDGLQIIEQILPYFNPDFTMSLKIVPESNIIVDVPIVLNSLDINDEYDGSFEERRFITHTLGFTLKTSFFGPVSESGVVDKIFVNTDQANLDLDGDVMNGNITTSWDEDLSD